MKMEFVEQLKEWAKLSFTPPVEPPTSLISGDTKFDYDNRVIHLKAPDSLYVIDGDAVESVTKHYGHRNGDD